MGSQNGKSKWEDKMGSQNGETKWEVKMGRQNGKSKWGDKMGIREKVCGSRVQNDLLRWRGDNMAGHRQEKGAGVGSGGTGLTEGRATARHTALGLPRGAAVGLARGGGRARRAVTGDGRGARVVRVVLPIPIRVSEKALGRRWLGH